MADLSDIESVLVSTIASIAYPSGTASPSIAGAPVKVYRGWPIAGNLDKDLRDGKINISVYPTDTEKRTTKYARDWMTVNVPAPSITLTASNNTITITGTPAPLQNACAVVNGKAYVYPVQAGDTPSSIATSLATQINNDTPATSSGGTISIPSAYSAQARVGTVGRSLLEIRRQRRNFQVSFWCPNPASRDLIASAVDEAMADIDFITLPDGSYGRVLYERSHVGDASEKEGLYRRDLFYSVEYATTQARHDSTILAPLVKLANSRGLSLPQDYNGPIATMQDGTHYAFQGGKIKGFNLGNPPLPCTLIGQSGRVRGFQDGSANRLNAGGGLPENALAGQSGKRRIFQNGALHGLNIHH